ncbi:hypothetical protein M9458_039548 [Cirrhinus mrigala]|uniref:Uncharacterized protein n=1 Tax=Cirrhinus mrigala TaxID=683832 RepID=A0ABD0NRB4_CIRMR
MNIQQAERPLEQYVEEFLSVLHLVSWSDSMINACFQMGLKDDRLFCSVTPDDCHRPVAEFINYVLALSNSNFYVDVKDSNLPPIRKHMDAPAHHQPASSTCCSNELTPSELLPHPQPRTPAVPPCLSRPSTALRSHRLEAAPRSSQPAATPRSGPTASNMASHICHKDTMDPYGLLSPSSPLVPSSPPEAERPPEPVPPERPPEPAPPERPPEPASPERPPEPAPPERPPGLCARPWLSELPDPPWPPELCTWLPDPPWHSGL